MALNKYRLGDLIELSEDKNEDLKYKLDDVKGISIKKMFIETKADMQGVSLKPYLLVKPDDFAYVTVTSRNGDKITLAHNDTNSTYIVSSSYVVFRIKRTDLLNSDFLFMYFNRSEFDRYSRFNSWGSARETFSWDDMCDIEIELPNIAIQEKYVKLYLSLLENQKKYEKGLDDLKLVCDGYIENLRKNIPSEKIGPYILCTDRKTDNNLLKIRGISNKRKFAESNSRVDGVDTNNYLKVDPGEFGYSPIHINEGSIAYNDLNCSYLLSPIYKTFKILDENILLPEYLMLWFSRDEFIRYCWFYAFGSARDTFEWNQMCEFRIPIPNLEIQQSIVNIFNVYNKRTIISEKLKDQIKYICSILIKGSIEEGRREA